MNLNRPSQPILQSVIAEAPFPQVNISNSVTLAQAGLNRVATSSYARARSHVVYLQAISEIGKTFLTDGVSQFWILGTILIGVGGQSQSINFDVPLRQLLAIPVSAETIEVSVKLIKRFVGADFNAVTSVAAYSFPPDPAIAAAGLVSPPLVRCGIAEDQNSVQSPASLTRLGIARSLGADAQFPIADGARSIMVYGDTAGGGVSLTLNSQPGFAVTGIPLNQSAPVPLPPSCDTGTIVTAANADFLVVQTMGF